MRINIYGLGFELTPSIVKHVESRIKLCLEAASDRIDEVSVRLSDINGTRGGVDKCCRIVIRQRQLPTAIVETVSSDLYLAVNEAANRARQSLWRNIKRRRTLRREYANRGSSRWRGSNSRSTSRRKERSCTAAL